MSKRKIETLHLRMIISTIVVLIQICNAKESWYGIAVFTNTQGASLTSTVTPTANSTSNVAQDGNVTSTVPPDGNLTSNVTQTGYLTTNVPQGDNLTSNFTQDDGNMTLKVPQERNLTSDISKTITSTPNVTQGPSLTSNVTPTSNTTSNVTQDGNVTSTVHPDGNLKSNVTQEGNVTSTVPPDGNLTSNVTQDGNSTSNVTQDGNVTSTVRPDGNLTSSGIQNGILRSSTPPYNHTEDWSSPVYNLQNGTDDGNTTPVGQTCESVMKDNSTYNEILEKSLKKQILDIKLLNKGVTFGTEGGNLVNATFILPEDAAAASRALKELVGKGLTSSNGSKLCAEFYLMLKSKHRVEVLSNYSVCDIRLKLLQAHCSGSEYCYLNDGTCQEKPVYQEFDYKLIIVVVFTSLVVLAFLVFLVIFCTRPLWHGKIPCSPKKTTFAEFWLDS